MIKSAKKTNPTKNSIALPKLTPVKQALQNHLVFSCFKTDKAATTRDWYQAAAFTVRDHVVERWVETANNYYEQDPKRIYYLSLEFLIGRMLSNAALNLGIHAELSEGLGALGHSMES
ncbi:MAG TPA: glycogen phosphorylase, partial [Methylotenera sp.]|nr:glycogen phosphorylase [Methylotenera sp.]